MIRVGVAGWDYPDWAGIVYPAGADRGFDRLAYLARFLDLIEIDSSFYRPIAPRVAESWIERTSRSPGLRFTAKAHRSLTHTSDASDLVQESLPTRIGLEPLRQSGRLGGVLLQFPQSFHFDEESRERLARLAEAFADWPVAVEVRHVSWETEEAAASIASCGFAWCAVDQPRAGRSTARLVERVTSSFGYVRLHGRNRADWFRGDAGRDARYDYLYARQELRALLEPVQRLAGESRELFVVQNNHFRGQAVANALQLRGWIEGRKPAAPAPLVEIYPSIAEDVVAQRDTLF